MVVALPILVCCAGVADSQSAPEDAFAELKSLAGEWQADRPGSPGSGTLTDSIRWVSNGKAVEETVGAAADNEVSIYTRDDKRVLLTHFCALTPGGHIARLETGPVSGAPARLEFILIDATNLPSPAAPHMRRLLLTFTDRDHFTESWTKTEGGKDTVFDLKFVRVVQHPPASESRAVPSPSHWLLL